MFKAKDKKTGEIVALKVVRLDEDDEVGTCMRAQTHNTYILWLQQVKGCIVGFHFMDKYNLYQLSLTPLSTHYLPSCLLPICAQTRVH